MFRSLVVLLSIIGLPASSLPEIDNTQTVASQKQELEFEKELLEAHFVPTQENNAQETNIDIKAKAALAVDLDSAHFFYSKNAHTRLPIASLTKIMTAIVVLEEDKLDEVVTIEFLSQNIEGKKMDLYLNEQITVYDLLQSALITSANDAAYALSLYHEESPGEFIEKMNNKAKELGLQNTHFANPIGFDDPENYSTAYDMALLTMYALKKPTFRSIVQKPSILVRSVNGFNHSIVTTNELLNNAYFGVSGVKTGTTDLAGECFISLSTIANNRNIITVVLNSPDRFQETKGLLNMVSENILR